MVVNSDFLLQQDLLENRQFQLFVDGVVITQSNGTNPRIRRLGSTQRLQYAAISETVPDYEVRVVLSAGMQFKIESVYQIRFDENTIKNYKCVGIESSYEQGLYVKIILALDNQVT